MSENHSSVEESLAPLIVDLLGFRTELVMNVFKEFLFNRRAEPLLEELLEVDRRGALHSVRTAELVAHLASGNPAYTPDRITQLIRAALVHDVGKIKVPTDILSSPSALSPDQRLEIQKHVRYGRDLLLEVGLSREAMVAYGHHKLGRDQYPADDEFDPALLRDRDLMEDITLINMVDIIDATRYPRVYRGDPVPREQLYQELDPFFSHDLLVKGLDAHLSIYAGAYEDK